MRQFTECPACACLVDANELTCSFCGAGGPRSVGAPSWLAVGFALGLGAAACGPKDVGDSDTDDTTVSVSASASASVGGSTGTGDTITDECFPDVPTYAGADEFVTITNCDFDQTTGELETTQGEPFPGTSTSTGTDGTGSTTTSSSSGDSDGTASSSTGGATDSTTSDSGGSDGSGGTRG